MKQTTFKKSTKSLFCMILALVLVFSLCLPTASAQNAEAVGYHNCVKAFADAPVAASAENLTLPVNDLPGNHNVIHDVGDNTMYENESNNSIALADVIYSDYTVSGYLTYMDLDYYGFHITSTSVIDVISISGYEGTTFCLLDSQENILSVANFDGYTSEGDAFNSMQVRLQPGVYYLCFLNMDAYTDDYLFYFLITSSSSSHQHSYSETVYEPTCTVDGYRLYTCSCGDSYTETIPATGHTWNEATCTAPKTCVRCGATEGSALGHTWIEATCTTAKTCTICGAIEGSALGHTGDEGVVTVAPTCDTTGIKVHTCSTCNSEYSEILPALGHVYDKNVCQVCGYVLTFTDVPNDAWYADPVSWAVGNGITNGIGGTLFGPDQNCNRAQVVTFLWRAAGCPEPTSATNPFLDVKEGDFYYKAVLWAVEKGITNGVSTSEFGPIYNCTRAQVVTFLWRASDMPESTAVVDFTDVQPNQFYSTAVAWAVENAITNGMGDGSFGVNGTCNRAQVVTFLYRALVQ